MTMRWLFVLSVVAAGCSIVDEPGSHGPGRPSSTTSVVGAETAAATLHCPSISTTTAPLPDDWQRELDRTLLASAFHGLDLSVSIWIDGYGEVAAVNPDTRLLPASNQKMFTAMGAFATLEHDHGFTTEVHFDDGALTLVAGGDPTLRINGDHSLGALARQVAAHGVGPIHTLGVDASWFSFNRTAVGWQDFHIPDYVGPLSAFTVNDNRYRTDEEFLFSPAVGNLETFADALRTVGVDVGGATIDPTGSAKGPLIASVRSLPMSSLLPDMLTRSDNETAEAILREVGGGSTPGGIEAVDEVLEGLCTGRTGQSGDGSGLSRENLRSAREWRSLLQAAASTWWGVEFRDALPVAGRSGTLARRLTGSTTRDNVSAKTGSIIGGQALSGYANTVDGRALVFSIIVNGDPVAVRAARPSIDAIVTAAVG